ncbi:hydroxyacylglutathione hydrolase [Nitrosomonas cryotolerans]|uniref:Hydroxyacylglutathione hydrolase n=1 Tax=Nitrosomonas cryotolerans ATCC 49181 TaxID=1131553 RepID=A0A1N6IPW0_9PROT|nr:hydroxyacylglutathione hydrolase [Nitrosomonas cryotolerans]SFP35020.1 hydroxyacylglutathione hydrolase [Nitrosomonas cryotolerans]SIO34062.1 hydroxyacylglutathione hydrolase [Nitrosomonas cryotolerans ATCC 49181]
MLTIYPVRAFKDNYIWVIHNQYYAAIVDPGDAVPVLDYLQYNNLQMIAILNTHHHHDHVGGNTILLSKFSVPVYGPKNELIPNLTHPVWEGDTIYLDELSLSLRVLGVPGHTAGHIAYYASDKTNLLFCGDTLFACGCGRIFEGTAEQMYASLQKLICLPDKTLVYCAHEYTSDNIRFARIVEPENTALLKLEGATEALRNQDMPTLPTTLAMEKATNPFLRCNQKDVINNTSIHAGRTLSDPVSVFTELRNWKNNF